MTTALRPPPDVTWSEDGFSIELGRLRRSRTIERRSRHVLILVVPLYALALVAEYSMAGSAFVLGTALVLFARQAMWLDERTLRVESWGLCIGRRRIGAADLVKCEIRGRSLLLTTRGGPWPLPASGLDHSEREWLCAQIQAIAERWQKREGSVPPVLRKVTDRVRRAAERPSAIVHATQSRRSR